MEKTLEEVYEGGLNMEEKKNEEVYGIIVRGEEYLNLLLTKYTQLNCIEMSLYTLIDEIALKFGIENLDEQRLEILDSRAEKIVNMLFKKYENEAPLIALILAIDLITMLKEDTFEEIKSLIGGDEDGGGEEGMDIQNDGEEEI